VVEALEAAGAVVVGITNLDQFATGLVGTRSPYGICPNAHAPGYVSGGSSSGSAVAVAAGLVDLALGTDTAGSGRVPAAANGIVGLKPTRGWVSTAGVVPACRSLDCVAVLARTVSEAAVATRIAAASIEDGSDPWRRTPAFPERDPDALVRVGVPAVDDLSFDGDPDGPVVFEAALERFTSALRERSPSAELVPIDVAPFVETGALLYGGSFVAERFAAVGPFVSSDVEGLDPVVHKIIARSEALAAWEVFRDLDLLQAHRQGTAATWDSVDAFVVPSIPRLPTVAQVRAEPIAVNAMLGTYTNFVNLLDLAALTIPVAGVPSPVAGVTASLTLVAPAWSDDLLVELAG
jgi:allophanate hydrolase